MTEPEAKPEAAPVQPTPVPPVPPEGRSTQDVLLIIAAIGAVVVNVVGVAGGIYLNAKIEASKVEATRVAAESDKKLEVIGKQTDGNLTDVKNELAKSLGEIELLKQLLIEEKKPEEKPKPETDP